MYIWNDSGYIHIKYFLLKMSTNVSSGYWKKSYMTINIYMCIVYVDLTYDRIHVIFKLKDRSHSK